jgi:hypothetical protein
MALWIKIEWSAIAEMFDIDKDGQIYKAKRHLEFKAGEAIRIMGANGEKNGFEMSLEDPKVDEEIDYYVMYVYPLDQLKRTEDFPNGTRLRAEGIHDRIIHPLYELRPNGQLKPPDPSRLVKVVLPVRTCRPKK